MWELYLLKVCAFTILFCKGQYLMVLSRFYCSVNKDGFWIGKCISWTLTDQWLQLIITVSQIHKLYSYVLLACCVFISLQVKASTGGRSPSTGFPNRPGLNCSSSRLSKWLTVSQSQSYSTTCGLPPISSSWRQILERLNNPKPVYKSRTPPSKWQYFTLSRLWE
jgi:hypothetical protein